MGDMEKFLCGIIFCVIACGSGTQACAQQKTPAEDVVIGSMFKTLANTYTSFQDIEKIKAKHIAQLEKMGDAEFTVKYAEIYAMLKALPQAVRAEYGITETASKAHIVAVARSLSKDKIHRIINALPDTAIANTFRVYMAKNKKTDTQKNTVEQVAGLWKDIISKN